MNEAAVQLKSKKFPYKTWSTGKAISTKEEKKCSILQK